jgi:hypothetical protein
LESLPGWDWSEKHQRQWHSRLAALRRYARAHDAGEIPVNAAIDRVRIGAWAAAQRAAHAAGTLPARNTAVLETIPGLDMENQSRRTPQPQSPSEDQRQQQQPHAEQAKPVAKQPPSQPAPLAADHEIGPHRTSTPLVPPAALD